MNSDIGEHVFDCPLLGAETIITISHRPVTRIAGTSLWEIPKHKHYRWTARTRQFAGLPNLTQWLRYQSFVGTLPGSANNKGKRLS